MSTVHSEKSVHFSTDVDRPSSCGASPVVTAASSPPATPLALPKKGASVQRDQIGARPKHIFCSECGEYVPINEWPNHRDRLRAIAVLHQVGAFHRTIIRMLGWFIMWILKSVYFREVTIVGEEHVPTTGAVVFYGNHQNQFIDALMMNYHCGRQVRFMMAEKSFHQPIIGTLGRMFDSVPVVRPQDVPMVSGVGMLSRMEETTIYGVDTSFSQTVAMGDVISWTSPSFPSEKCRAQVQRVTCDTQVEVTMPIPTEHRISAPVSFMCSKRIDHSEMYAQVYDTLANNHCIGIFPEGGSHDHTSLLPLKAGVALFSLGAAERCIPVKIVPCGLTYFYGHKFRSRAYMEFGEAITPPDDLVALFSTDKRKATGLFLEQLDEALRAVTINVPDYKTLNFLHSFRQLYQPVNCTLSARDYLRLMRRLGVVIEEQRENPTFVDFRNRVENYSDLCHALLVRDSQAATLKNLGTTEAGDTIPILQLLLRRAFTLIVMGVILVPFVVVGVPIGLIVEYFADKKTKAALRASKVKIVGADVKGSFKVMLGFMVVPAEFLLISFLTYLVLDAYSALIFLFCLPMAMYVSLLVLQEAVMEMRAALPLLMSLLLRHRQFKKLYEKRELLAEQAKQIVHENDPKLEQEMEVYTQKQSESDDELEREPSLFSLRYNVRRRQEQASRA